MTVLLRHFSDKNGRAVFQGYRERCELHALGRTLDTVGCGSRMPLFVGYRILG
ncbi:MAG: hypothetical protein ACI81Q_002140 [Paracoccaceae bacterium]|jgi:hypothetical protein